MSARSAILSFAIWFVLTVVQVLAALVSPAVAVVGGAGIALLSLAIFRFFALEFENVWAPLGIVAPASLGGVSFVYLADPDSASWTLWLAPLVAAVVSAMVILVTNRNTRRCELCNRRIGARDVTFRCPRCGLLVSDAGDCWIHERLRCRLCEENQVPVLSADKRWWDRQFGPRVAQGRCQLTLEDASTADLRACPHCGRLQSTLGWDMNNGQCARCGWILEDLPEPLRKFMSAGAERDVWAEQRGRGRRRPSASY